MDVTNFKYSSRFLLCLFQCWAWWHKANKIVGNNPKYIVGTYIHYVY